MPNLKSTRPIRKVAAGGVAGAITTILIYLVKTIWKVEVPADLVGAITTVISFVTAYMVPSAPGDLEAAPEAAPSEGGQSTH